MRIIDLEKWAVLKAAQAQLREATLSAIQESPGHTDNDLEADTLEFLLYELDKLVITIPTHKDFDQHIIEAFEVEAGRAFSSLEPVLTLPNLSQKAQAGTDSMRVGLSEGVESTPSLDRVELRPCISRDAWTAALSGLTRFNTSMESLMRKRTRPEASSANSLNLDPRHRARAEEILDKLERLSLICGSDHEHQMLLEISARIWKQPLEVATPLSLFITACSGRVRWHAVECHRFEDLLSSSKSKVDLEQVRELCHCISKCQRFDETLQLILKESIFHTGKYDRNPNQRQLFIPGKTIENLLDEDLLCPPGPNTVTATSFFRIQDKRTLTLDLAWSFLNLFGLDWTEGGWSSDKIFLPSSPTSSFTPAHVGKPPYISCQRHDNHAASQRSHDPREILFNESPFLSLGKLLVEIHIGRGVIVTEKNQLGEPSLYLTIAQIIDHDELWSANREYIEAVEGCLALHRSLHGSRDSEANSRESALQIYDRIVAKLEKDFSRYRRLNRHERQPQGHYFKSKIGIASLHLPSQIPHGRTTHSEPEIGKLAAGSFQDYPEHIRSADTGASDDSYKMQQGGEQWSKMKRRTSGLESTSHKRRRRVDITESAHPRRAESPGSPKQRSGFRAPSRREDFEVAIICALSTEYAAVEEIVDEFWDDQGDIYGKAPEDRNNYSTGRIGKHNVVLLSLCDTGKVEASRAAADMRLSYTGVKLALFVGVCGAVPQYTHGGEIREILLGDVIVGHTSFPYDFGRLYGDRFRPKTVQIGSLARSRKEIRALTNIYEQRRTKGILENRSGQILKDVQASVAKKGYSGEYDCPGTNEDKLFKPDYRHRHLDRSDCECSGSSRDVDPVCDGAIKATCAELQCDEREMVVRKRKRLRHTMPMLHIGSIASGDWVMKSGTKRDEVAKSHGVIAFEMEGAGIWDELPCLVVKGVADYADSHKSKDWQRYAAATAACTTKAILERYIRSDPRP